MDNSEFFDNLENAMVALDQEAIVSKTAESMAAGIDPLEILDLRHSVNLIKDDSAKRYHKSAI